MDLSSQVKGIGSLDAASFSGVGTFMPRAGFTVIYSSSEHAEYKMALKQFLMFLTVLDLSSEANSLTTKFFIIRALN